jgi:hypothetical protein
MNKERIQWWIEALRSGKYKQGKGYLAAMKKDGSTEYCCLGVACEVAIEHGAKVPKKRKENEWAYGNQMRTGFMPKEVVEWFGLPDWNPVVSNLALSEWNDDGVSFKRIATMIEREWIKPRKKRPQNELVFVEDLLQDMKDGEWQDRSMGKQ